MRWRRMILVLIITSALTVAAMAAYAVAGATTQAQNPNSPGASSLLGMKETKTPTNTPTETPTKKETATETPTKIETPTATNTPEQKVTETPTETPTTGPS